MSSYLGSTFMSKYLEENVWNITSSWKLIIEAQTIDIISNSTVI